MSKSRTGTTSRRPSGSSWRVSQATINAGALLRLGHFNRDRLADDAAAMAHFPDALAEFDSVEALDALLTYYDNEGETEHVKVLLEQVEIASGDAECDARTRLAHFARDEGAFETVIELLARKQRT